jgi:hypothetical protein
MVDNRVALRVIVASGILTILLHLLSGISFAENSRQSSIGGLSPVEALKIGERMYREGILASGEPMQALVQGDIPVDSTMFSCVSCHLRSGLGSLEGQVITYPIDGITLYEGITNAWNMRWVTGSKYSKGMTGFLRSAYNDETLAAAIRGGVNPDGKTLKYTMPRYPLGDKDMAILIFYLKNLSVKPSPGVSENSIRYATIVTEGVNRTDSVFMMSILKIMAASNKPTRFSMMALSTIASNPEDSIKTGYLNISVARWELKGSPASWRSQLDDYYKKEPVFAIVGGISNDDWRPIHEFCEENRIPCLLPITELPVISASDWYTLYFSKGFYQEGETAAKYLHGIMNIPQDIPVIQVYRNNRQGLAMAKGFEETWKGLRQQTPDKRVLTSDEPITIERWKQLAASKKQAIILLWLDSKDLSSIDMLADAPDRPKMVFLSSTLLGKEMYVLPQKIRDIIYITFPYRLPVDFAKSEPSFAGLIKNNQYPAEYPITRAKINFNLMILNKALFMMKGHFYRDRLLEVVDMMQDETTMSLYPRLSFGPGQRYLSKGCYIVKLGDGVTPNMTPVSGWVIP